MSDLPVEPGIYHLEISRPSSRVTLSLPPKIDSQSPLGLVVALHYGGPVTPFFGSSLLEGLIEPALRELNAVIAAPDCQVGTWDNSDSERNVLNLINILKDNYSIENRSVLLTGYSLGGIGTWYIAGRSQELFAAALPMAARPPVESSGIDWQLPLHVIHAIDDELFPIEAARDIVNTLKQLGNTITLEEVADAGHYELGRFYRPLRRAVPWITSCWHRY